MIQAGLLERQPSIKLKIVLVLEMAGMSLLLVTFW